MASLGHKVTLHFPHVPRKKITDLLQKEEDIPPKYYYDARYSCWPTIETFCNKPVHTTGAVYYFGHTIREFKTPWICPTLTRSCGSGGHKVPLVYIAPSHKARGGGHSTRQGAMQRNGVIRKLTPRECMWLQGFPDHFSVEGLADKRVSELCGNTCTLNVVYLVLRALVSSVSEE